MPYITPNELHVMALSWAIVLVTAIILVVNHSSYEDEVQEQRIYCENVSNGIHPDYNESFDEWCK